MTATSWVTPDLVYETYSAVDLTPCVYEAYNSSVTLAVYRERVPDAVRAVHTCVESLEAVQVAVLDGTTRRQ